MTVAKLRDRYINAPEGSLIQIGKQNLTKLLDVAEAAKEIKELKIFWDCVYEARISIPPCFDRLDDALGALEDDDDE